MVKKYRLGWATVAAGCFVTSMVDGLSAIVGLLIFVVWIVLLIFGE